VKFHVIVPVFNRADLLWRCLESIVEQEDYALAVVVADDASTDPEVASTIESWSHYVAEENWTHLSRPENVGATRNIVEAIRSTAMAPDDVIVIVDGDDRFAHPEAIAILRERYSFNGGCEVAYGSYYPDPFVQGCYPARPIPSEVLSSGSVRAFTRTTGQWFNHPLSFRRRVFDAVSEEDYHWNLDLAQPWLRYGYDVTMFIPMLEIAGRRAEWVPEFLYAYTSDRPEAVWRQHGEETSAEGQEVLGRERRYLGGEV
jgi:glycosyltransferase involved in cell wall biosynthesis